MNDAPPLVAVVMGSPSDWDTMRHTSQELEKLGVSHEARAISAHRQPHVLQAWVADVESRGALVFIAAAGGAAALPGVVASLTARPVLGVPMKGWATDGLDALLSIAQMPGGVPVGTLAIGKAGARNAAILAAQILGVAKPEVQERVKALRAEATLRDTTLPPPPKAG